MDLVDQLNDKKRNLAAELIGMGIQLDPERVELRNELIGKDIKNFENRSPFVWKTESLLKRAQGRPQED